MPTTPNNALRYPSPGDAPDGPGAIYNLASDVDNFLGYGTWTPVLGGTGAGLGSGGTTTGSWSRTSKQLTYSGRLAFGSGGSFGTGTPALLGWGASLNTALAMGTGIYVPASGGNALPVMLHPINPSQMVIRILVNNTYGYAYAVTPAQSDLLLFTINGTT